MEKFGMGMGKKTAKETIMAEYLHAAQEFYMSDVPGSFEARRSLVQKALKDLHKAGPSPDGKVSYVYIGMEATFSDYVLYSVENETIGNGTKYYKTEYSILDGAVTLGEPVEVKFGLAVSIAAKETLVKYFGEGAALEVGKRNSVKDESAIRNAIKLLMAIVEPDAMDAEEACNTKKKKS
jgi:hypothetical protein